MLKSLLPIEVKLYITIDDIRQGPNLTTNKTKSFTKKSFFCTILGFTQSHSGPLKGLLQGFIRKILGSYKSVKPIIFTGND